jgi:hypothetical protein
MGFILCTLYIERNSRSVQPKDLFHKVNGFNRGHFLLFILAVNLFVNFQRWWAPGPPMNIHDRREGNPGIRFNLTC